MLHGTACLTNKGHHIEIFIYSLSNEIISIEKLNFYVSPLGDTTAPVALLEDWVTLDERKTNLL